MAEGVLKEVPGNLPAQMVLIADRMRAEDDAGAIELIETALQGAPQGGGLHLAQARGAGSAAATTPRSAPSSVRMTELFPENQAVRPGAASSGTCAPATSTPPSR